MFETVELDRKMSKDEYKAREEALRQSLLELQAELRRLGISAVLVFGGVDGAGKSEIANLLSEWMDPRWMKTNAYEEPTEDEAERPEFWRYWRDLPGVGEIGLFLSAWYSTPLVANAHGGDDATYAQQLAQIAEFERMLAEDGVVVVKFWMHLSRDDLKTRLETLESDPLHAWRVGKREWKNFEQYDSFLRSAEDLIIHTSTGRAPWHLIEGSDPRYRAIKVGTLLEDALTRRVEVRRREEQLAIEEPALGSHGELEGSSSILGSSELQVPAHEGITILSRMDLSQSLTRKEYKARLEFAQARLGALHQRAMKQKRSLICVMEGMDAAGKGGAIRRAASALSSKHVRVIPIAAPTDEEKAHHYLWRFWRHMPRGGRATIFDRSWYGRVLVERVEGFASKGEWRRAYNEINHFELQLAQAGYIVAKFWVQISQEEQLARFEARANTPYKSWKLTEEDWRNRDKWPLYSAAVHDMVERTSTRHAPWHLIDGEDKKWSRVTIIERICDQLEAAVGAAENLPAPKTKAPKRKSRGKKNGKQPTA
jgi:polyphosphate:AMP phosphotransferase